MLDNQHLVDSISSDILQGVKRMVSLSTLTELSGEADVWSAIVKHSKTIAALQAKYGEQPASMHMYATSGSTSFKQMPGSKDLVPVSYKAWMDVNDAAVQPLEHRAETAKPTKRQEAVVMPFDLIVAKRDTLPMGSDERLLLSVYTLLSHMEYMSVSHNGEM